MKRYRSCFLTVAKHFFEQTIGGSLGYLPTCLLLCHHSQAALVASMLVGCVGRRSGPTRPRIGQRCARCASSWSTSARAPPSKEGAAHLIYSSTSTAGWYRKKADGAARQRRGTTEEQWGTRSNVGSRTKQGWPAARNCGGFGSGMSGWCRAGKTGR